MQMFLVFYCRELNFWNKSNSHLFLLLLFPRLALFQIHSVTAGYSAFLNYSHASAVRLFANPTVIYRISSPELITLPPDWALLSSNRPLSLSLSLSRCLHCQHNRMSPCLTSSIQHGQRAGDSALHPLPSCDDIRGGGLARCLLWWYVFTQDVQKIVLQPRRLDALMPCKQKQTSSPLLASGFFFYSSTLGNNLRLCDWICSSSVGGDELNAPMKRNSSSPPISVSILWFYLIASNGKTWKLCSSQCFATHLATAAPWTFVRKCNNKLTFLVWMSKT